MFALSKKSLGLVAMYVTEMGVVFSIPELLLDFAKIWKIALKMYDKIEIPPEMRLPFSYMCSIDVDNE